MKNNNLISAALLIFIFFVSVILNFHLYITQVTFMTNIGNNNFSEVLSLTSENSADNSISVIVTGDVNLGRSVNARIAKENNPAFPFIFTHKLLQSEDLTLINLESPLVNDCPITNEGMKFCGDEKNVDGLVQAGIDIASLANNHANDFGVSRLSETRDLLEKNGIIPIEHGVMRVIKIKDITLTFIGIDLVWHFISEADFINIMQKASQTDILIPFFHWGSEYSRKPNKIQKKYARLAIDNGADLVVGSHPHWIQEIEIYKNIPIIYSHGNFIFDQLWSEETRKGIVGKYIFDKKGLIDYEFVPIYINNYYQPEINNQQ